MWRDDSQDSNYDALPVPSWVQCVPRGLTADLGPGGRWWRRLLALAQAPLGVLPIFGSREMASPQLPVLASTTLTIRRGLLRVTYSVGSQRVWYDEVALSDIVKVINGRIVHRDGEIWLHTTRDRGELDALCQLIAHAVRHHRGAETSVRTLPWGQPPIQSVPSVGDLPDWALDLSLHGGELAFAAPQRLIASGAAMLVAGALGLSTLALFTATTFGMLGPGLYLSLFAGLLLLQMVLVAVKGLTELVWDDFIRFDGDNMVVQRRMLGRVYHEEAIPMRDVNAVRAVAQRLAFYLGDRVVTVDCHRPEDEVAALAVHLDRLVGSVGNELPEPPEELLRIAQRQRPMEGTHE